MSEDVAWRVALEINKCSYERATVRHRNDDTDGDSANVVWSDVVADPGLCDAVLVRCRDVVTES